MPMDGDFTQASDTTPPNDNHGFITPKATQIAQPGINPDHGNKTDKVRSVFIRQKKSPSKISKIGSSLRKTFNALATATGIIVTHTQKAICNGLISAAIGLATLGAANEFKNAYLPEPETEAQAEKEVEVEAEPEATPKTSESSAPESSIRPKLAPKG